MVAIGIFLISLGIMIFLTLRIRRLRAEKDGAVALAQEQQEQFARDVHDLVGHWLWLVSIRSELAYRHAAGDPRLRGELSEILQAVQHATHAVRNVSTVYRQLSLQGETMRAETLLSNFGAYCSVRMDVTDLPGDVSATLGTVVRESVTNMLRHSGVTRCAIELTEHSGRLRLTIANDRANRRAGDEADGRAGSGAPGRETESTGSGLGNLRHRVGKLGGTVRVTAGEDGWFVLIAELPVNFPE
ncbi:sensor histidine kinase [Streptosporangium lutulentum]|uniref:Two-component system sensor histidine kinase DesK n=1 Tax=Streptosporangium lutulentum TaxID=1461250 RepID=A0ABT9Q424_9ACTN|nr:histidine kinase [Streptosporangium lutulentum]MDP9841453.1 two-component system sensor histidine kinase DesK [Streptosporangium lutulentum]